MGEEPGRLSVDPRQPPVPPSGRRARAFAWLLLGAVALAASPRVGAGQEPPDTIRADTLGADTILRCWRDGARFSEAVQMAFLTLLAETPDTLIARKNGVAVAEDVSRHAAEVLAAGGALNDKGRAGIRALTRELRDEAHALNPGTTADLTCAALFVVILEGGWDR